MNDINKTLIALSGTDLARLAIPKFPDYSKIIFTGNIIAQIELMNTHTKELDTAHQIAISRIAPKMAELIRVVEKQYKPTIIAFQSIAEKLHPLLLQQTQIAEKFKNIASISNPTLEAIKTLSSINALSHYRETFEKFGGYIDPENITDEEIEQTISQNRELIGDVNTAVLNAEKEGVSPIDVPNLIYCLLRDKIPYLNERTYGIIVLIFTTVISAYGLYSNYTTNSAIDNEIIPALNKNSETLDEIKSDIEGIRTSIQDLSGRAEEVDSNLDSIKNSFDELEEGMEETNDKLELLYQKMLRQKSKNEEKIKP